MDFVYGEISQKALKNTYLGGRTNTADVRVDDSTSTIYVDAHADTSYVSSMIDSKINQLDYSDSAVNQQFVTSVSETNGIISVTRSGFSLTPEQIPELQQSKITGLTAALNSKQNTITSSNKLSASLVDGLATVATTGAYSDLSGTPAIPTKTSDIINDSGFITNTVNNLTNYTTTPVLTDLLAAKQATLVSGTNIKTINNQSIVGSGNLALETSWGSITGNLSAQTDLSTALASKLNASAISAYRTSADQDVIDAGKQATLVGSGEGQNIKTVGGVSIMGTGNIPMEAAVWGHITGTLNSQTDLKNALALKANSADLSTVATSGNYNDLTNKPVIPTDATVSGWGYAKTTAIASTYRTSAAQDIIDATKQATLVSNVNIKTINNQSLLGSGNIIINLGLDQISDYDPTKIQRLVNHQGSFMWVDEV